MLKKILLIICSFSFAYDLADITTVDAEILNIEKLKTISTFNEKFKDEKNGDRIYIKAPRQAIRDMAQLKLIKIKHDEHCNPVYDNQI